MHVLNTDFVMSSIFNSCIIIFLVFFVGCFICSTNNVWQALTWLVEDVGWFEGLQQRALV